MNETKTGVSEDNEALRSDLAKTRDIVARTERELESMSNGYREEITSGADEFLTDFKAKVDEMQEAANNTVRDRRMARR